MSLHYLIIITIYYLVCVSTNRLQLAKDVRCIETDLVD